MNELIKAYREAKGWTQTKLAKESGVSQTYISELEAGKYLPNLSILRKLAFALGISISELLNEERPTGTDS